jgi:hypothetical protein
MIPIPLESRLHPAGLGPGIPPESGLRPRQSHDQLPPESRVRPAGLRSRPSSVCPANWGVCTLTHPGLYRYCLGRYRATVEAVTR